jgi:hypothetical protein
MPKEDSSKPHERHAPYGNAGRGNAPSGNDHRRNARRSDDRQAHYVIPVDQSGIAYLSLKAREPLTWGGSPKDIYCAGCPSVFGGNKERNDTHPLETLSREIKEETHQKLNLTEQLQIGSSTGKLTEIFRELRNPRKHINKDMYFHYLEVDMNKINIGRGHTMEFINSLPEKQRNSYLETTGDIIEVDLKTIGDDKHTVCNQLIKLGCDASNTVSVDPGHRGQFESSATLEAVIRAAAKWRENSQGTAVGPSGSQPENRPDQLAGPSREPSE